MDMEDIQKHSHWRDVPAPPYFPHLDAAAVLVGTRCLVSIRLVSSWKVALPVFLQVVV